MPPLESPPGTGEDRPAHREKGPRVPGGGTEPRGAEGASSG